MWKSELDHRLAKLETKYFDFFVSRVSFTMLLETLKTVGEEISYLAEKAGFSINLSENTDVLGINFEVILEILY